MLLDVLRVKIKIELTASKSCSLSLEILWSLSYQTMVLNFYAITYYITEIKCTHRLPTS